MKSVSPHILKQWLDEGAATLIDVREAAEHASQHIEGARLVPLSRLDAKLCDAGDKKLVVHCYRGGRGSTACARLQEAMPECDIYNLEGGIQAWEAAGFPTSAASESGAATSLPLDRQVQLTIGLLLLVATALAWLVHPAFVFMAGAIGFGLSVAGLTGFCGLAMLIARMPWNACKAEKPTNFCTTRKAA